MASITGLVTCYLTLHYLATAQGLIIPGELTSLMSVIFSNIPTVKKGTDSRLGWGFRMGDRADFQILLELGPQTNTQPLVNQVDGNSKVKRSVDEVLRNKNQVPKADGQDVRPTPESLRTGTRFGRSVGLNHKSSSHKANGT